MLILVPFEMEFSALQHGVHNSISTTRNLSPRIDTNGIIIIIIIIIINSISTTWNLSPRIDTNCIIIIIIIIIVIS